MLGEKVYREEIKIGAQKIKLMVKGKRDNWHSEQTRPSTADTSPVKTEVYNGKVAVKSISTSMSICNEKSYEID